MEKKTLFETIKFLNHGHDKASNSKVRAECDRIYILSQDCTIDFTKGLTKYVYSSGGSKRFVAKYTSAFDEGYSVQRNLAHQISKACKINYPNRALMIHELFECTKIMNFMMNYTIIRFDFKGYFYSIKPKYVWDYYLNNSLPGYVDQKLIRLFCEQIDIAYPGLEMSNILAEIMGIEFDRCLKSYIQEYGILFYGRFVDDGILILKENVDKAIVLSIFKKAQRETFKSSKLHVKCTASFHKEGTPKFFVCTMKDIYRAPMGFSFLGYLFNLEYDSKDNLVVLYGVSANKIQKYKEKLIRALNKSKNAKQCLLTLRMQCSRVVYSIKSGGIDIWKERGFPSVYKELGEVEESLILPSTKASLDSLSIDAINSSLCAGLLSLPQKYAVEHGRNYNYYYSITKRKTIIFDYHSRIGCDWRTLVKYVRTVNGSCRKADYQSLTKELLIKTNIGY